MSAHRIVSVEMGHRSADHQVVVAVNTRDEPADDERWTVQAVLKAMNRAERFYTQAPNGRQARVQRYQCARCHGEHIRTHLSDAAIHEMRTLR